MSAITAVFTDPNVVSTVITVFGGGIVAAVGILAKRVGTMTRETRAVREDSAATRHQVQNHHSTNLREDLDRVHADVRAVLEGQARHDDQLRQHGASIGGIRDDLRMERAERLALAGRVDVHIAQN